MPNTPAVNQAKAWLEVFNAGDPEKHKEFLRKNAPTRVERADREMGFREMTGGFDVKKVEESTPTKIVALVQERASDQLARFTLEVGAAPQHQITRLGLEATARPAEFALPHLSESELITAARKKLDEEAAADRVAGPAVCWVEGRPLEGGRQVICSAGPGVEGVEDVFAVGAVVLAVLHPVVVLVLILIFLLILAWVLPKVVRRLRKMVAAALAFFRGKAPA